MLSLPRHPAAQPAGFQQTSSTEAPAESELLNGRLVALRAREAQATASELPGGLQRYQVQPGDNLWDIAQKLGSSVEQIVASNNLGRSDLVGPGTKLLVPVQPGFAYTVQSGDSFSSLADRFGITADAIQAANELGKAEVLQPGQLLFLPGARPPSRQSVQIASASRSIGSSRDSGSWLWPVHGPITSPFGLRWGRFHEGIDIGVGSGTSVHAARGGRVTLAGWDGGYGKAVIINHGNGLSTLYGHLSKIDVSVGAQVDQGTVIGLSGSTGESTGPHLHFEVRVGGIQKNPLSFLP
ncbi:MAG: peptidoglycan DD-metalloendopeptidase family protein [Symbiobacteriia bacterium]